MFTQKSRKLLSASDTRQRATLGLLTADLLFLILEIKKKLD